MEWDTGQRWPVWFLAEHSPRYGVHYACIYTLYKINVLSHQAVVIVCCGEVLVTVSGVCRCASAG